jgi:hypothetical protein
MPYSKELVAVDHPPYERRRLTWAHTMAALMLGAAMAALVALGTLPPRPAVPARPPQIAAPPAATPTIHVAPVTVAEPWAETPLPIQLVPAGLVPHGGWLKIDGLPALASLSDGHATGPGAWRVPVAALATLKIIAPTGARTEVAIALTTPDGAVLTRAQSVLVALAASHVGSDPAKPALRGPAAAQPVVSRDFAASLFDLDARRRAQNLVRKGDDSMSEGNVATARAFYERAARMGWSQAAIALAATYDPNEAPHRWAALGLAADPDAARAWYAKARDLAHAEATEIDFYLKRLGSAAP